MHALTHTSALTFCQAEDIILAACRKNACRISRNLRGHTVTFYLYGSEMQAVVRDMQGNEVATATVDKHDN